MTNLIKTTLGSLVEFQRGYDLPKSKIKNGKYPVISSNGILGYHNEYKVTGPGITIGRSGTVGIPQLIEKNFFPHNTSLYIKNFKGNDVKFIFYFLKHLNLNNKKSGSGVPTMNRNHLHPISIKAIKNKIKQIEIGNLLYNLDKKIEINNKVNIELEAIAKLIYDYWFMQFDFPDENGKPYKSSGGKMIFNKVLKREIPDGWNDISLGNIIVKSGTGLNPRNNFTLGEGSNYYITIKNIKNGKIIFDDKTDRISDKSLEIINKRSDLQIGDILFTSIDPVGVTYFIQEKPKNWNINESVFTLRANKKFLTPEFLFAILSSKEMKLYSKHSSAGSIHKGIRHEVLKDFKLPYGGMSIILPFTKILKPLLECMHTLDIETQNLIQLRDWLLPMLMNDQVTVSETS